MCLDALVEISDEQRPPSSMGARQPTKTCRFCSGRQCVSLQLCPPPPPPFFPPYLRSHTVVVQRQSARAVWLSPEAMSGGVCGGGAGAAGDAGHAA